ncbi:hypothetical protein J7337_001689 [Fusarium musae]|uniref:Uncharacterized protein n=1 Tax=Fusarium musae TaxID=1042133 RepID=A0A9P8DTZ9_9HYPO|nr:hypothetical protein J7337_001689 [Fusarium musae]KAG9508127.1 hypothetical protein J7337_001689 [Fusarium musae]
MRSKHQIFITVPIPSRVPPEIVLAHIQTYTPMLANNNVIMSFKETTPNMELRQNLLVQRETHAGARPDEG